MATSGTGFEMCVFRDGRRACSGNALRAALIERLRALAEATDPAATREHALAALLCAGALECALADLDHHEAALAARCTDMLARNCVSASAPCPPEPPEPGAVSSMLGALERAALPAQVAVSRPEGFAYYALHPLDFARATEALHLGARPVFVVGLRSIGTTLGAVVAAAARRCAPAERITVRPTGHPYDRRLALTERERAWVARGVACEAVFVVVDEGPGLSGSSLLAVAEALHAASVPCARIVILCSHAPDFGALLARDAAQRYARFRVQARVPSAPPAGAVAFLGGGAWRGLLYGDASRWPASWTAMERLKYRGDDGRLLKFEGLGNSGDEVAARAHVLADAGFGPAVRSAGNGFFSYEWVNGRPLAAADLDPHILARMAGYCALRARVFPAGRSGELANPTDLADLAAMARANHAAELGREPARPLRLPCPRPVIADCRMLPHEWIRADSGRVYKVDGASHGDDHFFPGPTDIAWDLAGIAVEWGLSSAACEHLLNEYRVQSGDDARERMGDYMLAYTLFRLAYVKMAAASMAGSDEAARLSSDYRRYRRLLDAMTRAPANE